MGRHVCTCFWPRFVDMLGSRVIHWHFPSAYFRVLFKSLWKASFRPYCSCLWLPIQWPMGWDPQTVSSLSPRASAGSCWMSSMCYVGLLWVCSPDLSSTGFRSWASHLHRNLGHCLFSKGWIFLPHLVCLSIEEKFGYNFPQKLLGDRLCLLRTSWTGIPPHQTPSGSLIIAQ